MRQNNSFPIRKSRRAGCQDVRRASRSGGPYSTCSLQGADNHAWGRRFDRGDNGSDVDLHKTENKDRGKPRPAQMSLDARSEASSCMLGPHELCADREPSEDDVSTAIEAQDRATL